MPAPWWGQISAARWLWVPLLAFGMTRLGIAIVIYVSAPMIPDATSPPPYYLRPDNILLDTFGSRWDTGFYLEIAEQGYTYTETELPSVAFFPLLSLIIRAVSSVIGDALIAGLLITNVALIGAMILFYRLVDEEWGQAIAERAVWYILIFPTSFFGSAIYTESLLLLTTIGACYCARKRFWESAGLLGFAAGLTRPLGFLTVLLLFAEWIRQRRMHDRPPPLFTLLAMAAPLLGTVTYMLYLYARYGDPRAFFRAQAAWDRTLRSAYQFIFDLLQTDSWTTTIVTWRIPLNNWIDLLFALLFLILGFVLLRQRRWGEGLFVLMSMGISLSTGNVMSLRRYVWVLFPAFILLARWGRNPWIDKVILALSLLGLSFFTALFANWYWVA